MDTAQYESRALEWVNQNMHRNYPVVDGCVMRSSDGLYVPTSFLADASIAVPAVASDMTSRFFISRIYRVAGGFKVDISFDGSNGDIFKVAESAVIPAAVSAGDSVAAKTVALSASTSTIPDAFRGLRALTGCLIIGSCADMGSCSEYQLDVATGLLMPVCIHIMSEPGIRSLTVIGASGTKTVLTDDFDLVAGDGIDFSVNTSGGSTELVICRAASIAEQNARYTSLDALVAAVYTALGTPVRTVNGVEPDENGNVSVTGLDCTEVSVAGNGITISNPCAKPCCSETTAEDIDTALDSMEESRKRLTEYYETLSGAVNSLQLKLASLIASK